MASSRVLSAALAAGVFFLTLPANADIDVCQAAREKAVGKFRKTYNVDARIKAYESWRGKTWHAAALLSQRLKLIRESLLNDPDGINAQKALTAGGVSEDAKISFAKAYSRRAFPVVLECPKGSSPDEKFRDPSAYTETRAIYSEYGSTIGYEEPEIHSSRFPSQLAGPVTRAEELKFPDRYKAALVKLEHGGPLRSLVPSTEYGPLLTDSKEEESVEAAVGWCRVDSGDENEGDLRFPLTWSRPAYNPGVPGYETPSFTLMAGDVRFSKRDERGNVRPPHDLSTDGHYFAYAKLNLYQLLNEPELEPHQVLDRMVERPQTEPDDDWLRRELRYPCDLPTKTEASAPAKSITDKDAQTTKLLNPAEVEARELGMRIKAHRPL